VRLRIFDIFQSLVVRERFIFVRNPETGITKRC